MIHYKDSLDDLESRNFAGLCAEWRKTPSPEALMELARQSDYFLAAVEERTGTVIGVITCITDNFLFAYITLLEVRPEYQHRGVGSELMRRVMKKYGSLYKIDLCCDSPLQSYYERFGMEKVSGMTLRNLEYLPGEKE